MRSELEETKLTAYALGLLDGKERVAVERFLAASEGARREVEEIRETATALREAFGTAPGHSLTPEQRRTIEAAAVGQPVAGVPAKRRFPGSPWLPATVAAAAVAAIMAWRFHPSSTATGRASLDSRRGRTNADGGLGQATRLEPERASCWRS
jgi:anti-sigma factor RsiW